MLTNSKKPYEAARPSWLRVSVAILLPALLCAAQWVGPTRDGASESLRRADTTITVHRVESSGSLGALQRDHGLYEITLELDSVLDGLVQDPVDARTVLAHLHALYGEELTSFDPGQPHYEYYRDPDGNLMIICIVPTLITIQDIPNGRPVTIRMEERRRIR